MKRSLCLVAALIVGFGMTVGMSGHLGAQPAAVPSVHSGADFVGMPFPLPPPPVLCGCVCPDGSFTTTHAPNPAACPSACAAACASGGGTS